MSDYKKENKKKKIGFFGVLLVIAVVLLLLLGLATILLPKIIGSALDGGAVSTLLPEEIQENTAIVKELIDDNLDDLEKSGLSPLMLTELVEDINYKSFKNILKDIEVESVKNSSQLFDIISKYTNNDSIDFEKIKREYYSEINTEELNEILKGIKSNPLAMTMGFSVTKNTILEILKDKIQEPLGESGITPTSKKGNKNKN